MSYILVETNRDGHGAPCKWRTVTIGEGSPVDRALNGALGSEMDHLRLEYRRIVGDPPMFIATK